MKALLDFIPLIAFFIGAMKFDIWVATAALLGATLAVAVVHLILQKGKLTKQQLIIVLVTVAFCGLTLALRDDIFVKAKSSVINTVFAVVLVGSVLLKKPLLKLAMKDVFLLTPQGWNKLTLVWAGFFVLMAVLHYVTAFHMSYTVWYQFKTWGGLPIMLTFMVAQFIFLKDHLNPELSQKQVDGSDKK